MNMLHLLNCLNNSKALHLRAHLAEAFIRSTLQVKENTINKRPSLKTLLNQPTVADAEDEI